MEKQRMIDLSIERCIQSWFCDGELVSKAIKFTEPLLVEALKRLDENPTKYIGDEEDVALRLTRAQNKMYIDLGFDLKLRIYEINHLINASKPTALLYSALYYVIEYWYINRH